MTPDYGIYIHVPFCTKRCPYCAFVLIESDGSLHERFVQAVGQHLERAACEQGRVRAASLYFGGGTPSLLQPAEIARLIAAAHACFDLGESREVTLEANPDGLDSRRLHGFREAGVNRLSIGVQSLWDDELSFLGRTHSAVAAREAFRAARSAGFDNICVDLIYGLPGQDEMRWRRTLEEILSWSVEHISLYGLTVESGTELKRRVTSGLVLPGDGVQRTLYQMAMDLFAGAGYQQYELSNFAREGFESRHNSGYWDGRPYLGFGPGAHSYVPYRRWATLSNTRLYLEQVEQGRDVTGMSEVLTREQRMLERVFLGLRRAVGIDADAWREEFGEAFQDRYGAVIAEGYAMGWLEWRGRFLTLTGTGKHIADSVVAKFA